jgi:hypothetical protein
MFSARLAEIVCAKASAKVTVMYLTLEKELIA